jgi:hypothetical protein
MIRHDWCVCRTVVDEQAEDEMEQRRCNAEMTEIENPNVLKIKKC